MGLPAHPLLDEGFRIVAYRGGGGERPENTLAAFEQASSLGAEVVLELDVRRTADGVLVAMHDADVGRTTDGQGLVASFSYERLRRLNAGYHFDPAGGFRWRGAQLRVPRVAEVLSAFPQQRVVLDVHSDHPSIAAELTALVRAQQAAERVVIASELSHVVHAVKRLQPSLLVCGTAGQLLSRVLLERVRLDRFAPATGGVLMIPEIHRSLRVLSPRFLRQAHARGERVWVWVVEHVSELGRLRALGVDAVFTPFPSAFQRHLGGVEVATAEQVRARESLVGGPGTDK
jgi:glycerophosphoryl diester phosphodiesterase